MTYTTNFNLIDGEPVVQGPDTYGGPAGAVLYTGSGPLWRTKLLNWEGVSPANNSAANPNPQPFPDPCKRPDINQRPLICTADK
jgi:hypothetical protein